MLLALDTHDLCCHPAFLFVVGAVACATGLLFWPVEVIMVGFFAVSELQIMTNASLAGSRQWLNLNRPVPSYNPLRCFPPPLLTS